MLRHYKDILDRIPEPPKWWDEHGVPRWCAFNPHEIANIYAKEAALLEIACQRCHRRFKAAVSSNVSKDDPLEPGETQPWTLARLVQEDDVRYGDPPNVGCCEAGASDTALVLRVIQFWSRDDAPGSDYRRIPSLEIRLPDADDV